jgi:5-hydroxyisourate hydrolase
MSRITTHVLDIARGEPARGLAVTLQRLDTDGLATTIGAQTTDDDGRATRLFPDDEVVDVGRYRLLFEAGAYLRAHGVIAFFPLIAVEFEVTDGERHHHVPLLVSPFGYSTYRGS